MQMRHARSSGRPAQIEEKSIWLDRTARCVVRTWCLLVAKVGRQKTGWRRRGSKRWRGFAVPSMLLGCLILGYEPTVATRPATAPFPITADQPAWHGRPYRMMMSRPDAIRNSSGRSGAYPRCAAASDGPEGLYNLRPQPSRTRHLLGPGRGWQLSWGGGSRPSKRRGCRLATYVLYVCRPVKNPV